MEKFSKYIIWIIFIWYGIFSILTFIITIPANILQILFSIPIAFIGLLSAQKPKSLDVIRYEENQKRNLEGRNNSKIFQFERLIIFLEGFYRKDSRHHFESEYINENPCHLIGGKRYTIFKNGNIESLKFQLSIKEKDVILVRLINAEMFKLYDFGDEKGSTKYSDPKLRMKFYKSVKKKYLKDIKYKIPKY
jgi:hypothetical protein